MNQPKYVKGKDGKFKGSVGAGKTAPGMKPAVPALPSKTIRSEAEAADGTYTPDETLVAVYLETTSLSQNQRQRLAAYSEVTADQVHILAKDPDVDVRVALAGNDNIPWETVQQLAEDDEWRVRESVTGNRNLGEVARQNLAEDDDWRVREMVAKSENTSPYLLRQLGSATEIYDVRHQVSTNMAAPRDVLKELSGDESELIRALADQTLRRKKAKGKNHPFFY